MAIPKLPILTPWRSRDVLLLPIALHVRLFVLGGIEHGFSLLRRHTRNGLGCGRLVLALSRRWSRRLALSASTPTAAASTTTAPSAVFLFLAECQLVIPARVRIRDCHLENLFVAIQRAIERSVGGVLRLETLHQIVEAEIES